MTGRASPRLRRQFRGVAVALGAGLVGIAIVLDGTRAPPRLPAFTDNVAVQWAIPAAVAAGYVVWFCRRHLDANHPDGTTAVDDQEPAAEPERAGPYATLGVANAVTLARGGLFAAVAGFAAVEPMARIAWVPAVCYGTGCLLDIADGTIARWRDRATRLGAKLDMGVDTLGFLVAPVVAVLWGRLPVWYLSLSLARYLFKAGRGARRARGKPVFDLPPSAIRRTLAGVQMGFITVALAPVLPRGTVRVVAAVVLAPSLVVFARDYLVVSGRLGTGEGGG